MSNGKKILVIGETCEDIFIYGECDRLNPEAPTPVLVPSEKKINKGMAANTFNNLKHLGLECDIITNTEIIQKIRYVDIKSNYILLRVDVEGEELESLVRSPEIGDYDVIVIADYNKGLLSTDFLCDLFNKCKKNNISTFMDTKKIIGDWSSNCDFIKINQKEFNNNKDSDLGDSVKDKLIITLGADGCKYKDITYDTNKVYVRDVAGAGDTFLAGLVMGYLNNKNIVDGIRLANKLAANVVTKRGVSLPNRRLL